MYIISNFSNNEFINLDNKFYERFLFIKAKLFGYTENEIKILENYLHGDSLEYGKSIILANQGKLLKSLKIINKILPDKLKLLIIYYNEHPIGGTLIIFANKNTGIIFYNMIDYNYLHL